MQLILKSNSTSFIVNNNVCEINIKKVTNGVIIEFGNRPNILLEL